MTSECSTSSDETSLGQPSSSSGSGVYQVQRKTVARNQPKPRSKSDPPYKFIASCYETHYKTIYGCAFSSFITDIPHFATVGDNRIAVYCLTKDSRKIRLVRNFKDDSKDEAFFAVCWAYNTDDRTHVIVAGGSRGIMRVIDADTGDLTCSLVGHGDAVNDIRICPKDSMIVASASKDRTARIWNITNSSCLAVLGGVQGHMDQVISVDFDVSSNFLASASMDHSVKLWYIGEGSGVDRMIEQSKSDVKLVDVETEIHFPRCSTRDVHTNYVDCVRIFHKMIFSKSTEDEIVLWKFGDLKNGLEGKGTKLKTEGSILHLRTMALPDTSMWFIKFEIDPTEKYLLCGTQKGEIHVWDLKNGCLPSYKSDYVLTTKECHSTIRQLAFSPCGQHMIAVADDASVSRYDLFK